MSKQFSKQILPLLNMEICSHNHLYIDVHRGLGRPAKTLFRKFFFAMEALRISYKAYSPNRTEILQTPLPPQGQNI